MSRAGKPVWNCVHFTEIKKNQLDFKNNFFIKYLFQKIAHSGLATSKKPIHTYMKHFKENYFSKNRYVWKNTVAYDRAIERLKHNFKKKGILTYLGTLGKIKFKKMESQERDF